jgi:rhodanese-related sulfurtransferase
MNRSHSEGAACRSAGSALFLGLMKRRGFTWAVVGSALILTVALTREGARQGPVEVREASVSELVSWTAAREAIAVDANDPQTRARHGIIPGALLLTSSSEYPLAELPADRRVRLVFYCANERCSASQAAARRAVEHGYSDVAVLAAGIFGWKKAGQLTAPPRG